MGDKITSFEDLNVWKNSRELENKFIKLAISFPKYEKFRLTEQLIELHIPLQIILLKVMVDFIIKKISNLAELAEVLYLIV